MNVSKLKTSAILWADYVFVSAMGIQKGPVNGVIDECLITLTPVPEYHLLEMKDYVTMNMQFSRGCPFSYDFSEISSTFVDIETPPEESLLDGYKKIIQNTYETKPYYKRIRRFL